MKISVFQIILLCVFGALAAVGVAFFALFQIRGSSASSGPVVLWGTFDEGAVLELITNLGETYPDLKNVTYVQKEESGYEQALTEALASGTAPDLYIVTNEHVYADRNRLRVLQPTEVSPSDFADKFVDGAAPFVTPSGVLGLPILADPLVLYWNKDLLATAGFPQPPQDWARLLEYVQRVTRKTDAGTLTTSAVALGGYRNIDHAKEILTMLIVQAGGEVTTLDQSGVVTSALLGRSAGAASAVPSAVRFYTNFADPARPEYTWNNTFPNSQRAFAATQLALYLGRASERAALRAANPNLNFSVAAVPQIEGTQRAADGGRVYGVVMPKAARNSAGALQVMFLLASADVSKALSESLGLPSARRDVLAVQRQSTDSFVGLTADETTILRTWYDVDPDKTDLIFQAMIEAITSNALTLSEALARAEQQINNLTGI